MSHGMSRTRLYRCWQDMKDRCLNKNNKFYHRYGGRGISFCNEWKDFEPFRDWALANGYDDKLTIDRIDNDGNYCPENCKWSTQHEQSLNKTHIPNRYGHVGIRRLKRNGKYEGYKAVVCHYGKEVYLGYSLSLEEAIRMQEEGARRVRASGR